MKAIRNGILILMVLGMLVSCAGRHADRFNTQRGAAIGAGVGALAGQLIGRNTKGVRMIKLGDEEKVVAMDKVPPDSGGDEDDMEEGGEE